MDKPLFTMADLEDRADGFSTNVDIHTRRKYCTFIHTAGMYLDIPEETIALAQLLFQRFFTVQSYRDFDIFAICRITLMVACKVHEVKRRVRDIINVVYILRHPNEEPLKVSKKYWKLKEKTTNLELVFMNALGFKLQTVLPHHVILICAEILKLPSNITRLAWGIINDSLLTYACLIHTPIEVAVSAIFLAGRILSEPVVPTNRYWYEEEFDVSKESIESVCGLILDLYESSTTKFIPSEASTYEFDTDSTPNFPEEFPATNKSVKFQLPSN